MQLLSKEPVKKNQRRSTLPLILTHKPRHRSEAGDWYLEFALGDLSRELTSELSASGLLIRGTALNQMAKNRAELAVRTSVKLRLQGLEEFLRELNRLALVSMAVDKTYSVSHLLVRAVHDFILAVDGTLAGVHTTVFESMRDVMEVELLVREFQNQPHRISEWATADNDTLKKKFAPGVLRQLHAKRLGVKPQDVPGYTDYQGHSIGVHVTPFSEFPPFGSRDMIVDPSDPFAVEACFWEILGHAHSLLTTLRAFLGDDYSRPEENKRLRAFLDAYTEIKKSQDLYYAILAAIARQLPAATKREDATIDIEISVVPEEYRSLFRALCDDRPLKAKVFRSCQS